MHREPTPFIEQRNNKWHLISPKSKGSPTPELTGTSSIRKMMGTLYALAFLFMLLWVLSLRMAGEKAANNRVVKLMSHDTAPGPDKGRQPGGRSPIRE